MGQGTMTQDAHEEMYASWIERDQAMKLLASIPLDIALKDLVATAERFNSASRTDYV